MEEAHQRHAGRERAPDALAVGESHLVGVAVVREPFAHRADAVHHEAPVDDGHLADKPRASRRSSTHRRLADARAAAGRRAPPRGGRRAR